MIGSILHFDYYAVRDRNESRQDGNGQRWRDRLHVSKVDVTGLAGEVRLELDVAIRYGHIAPPCPDERWIVHSPCSDDGFRCYWTSFVRGRSRRRATAHTESSIDHEWLSTFHAE